MQPLELYIHIPFCVKKCAYCDFLSGPAGEKEKEEYVKMLVDEIRNCPDTVQNYRVISIFFGGGTPSLLTGEQIGRLMDTVREIFTLDEDAEITMEMNPGTVTEEKLRKYRQAGVNRLRNFVCLEESILMKNFWKHIIWREPMVFQISM